MTWKGRLLQRLAPFLDVLMLPVVWLSAQHMMLIRRATARRLPCSMAMLDRIGIYPLIDHYYEPLINLRRLRHPLDRPRALPAIEIDAARALGLLEQLTQMSELADAPRERPRGRLEYYRENDFFGPLDAGVLYALMRRYRPRRMIEVGCGISTCVAIQARMRNRGDDPQYVCEHICIEPYEQPWLADAPVTLLRTTAESWDSSYLEALEENDILFIDSSHVIRPQGDVLTEILDWLVRLRPGVLVHFHDIFTPRDYPDELVRQHRLFWNEQYLLEAFLCFNDRFEVLLPLNHLFETYKTRIADICPAQLDGPATTPASFWLRRRR